MSFYLEMVLVGCLVGLLNGAFGIGGGILMIPAMHQFVPGIDAHTAKGTSLFIIFFVAAINAWRQNRPFYEIPWRAAVSLCAGSMAGGYAGAWFTGMLSGDTIIWIYIGVLSLICFRLLIGVEPNDRAETHGVRRYALGGCIGLATGVVGGMTGVGGGLVLVPLALLAGLSTYRRVTALSNLVMVGTSLAAVAVQIRAQSHVEMPGTIGQVHVWLALAIFVGAQVGSPFGRRLNERLTYRQRTRALVVMLVLVAARMLYEALA